MRSALSRVIEAIELSPRDSDASAPGSSSTGVPDDFIPDDKLVHRELADSCGYMWQASIAAEFGWSSAKTSRVLCEMERNELIQRRRIGRRKIVYLPDRVSPLTRPVDREPSAREHAVIGQATDG